MNPECKKYILEWIGNTFSHLICKEEDLIQDAVATVHGMFMQCLEILTLHPSHFLIRDRGYYYTATLANLILSNLGHIHQLQRLKE